MATPQTASEMVNKRSGLKIYEQGHVLFNEGDVADSLFIIQKGQVRLYRPKGKGFVEIAVLRAGEVIGEMAYFDEQSRTRSCSAAAIVHTEVIEISFKAFEKTIQGLNPWFKTIIITLANRLRKSNERVKALEGNSVLYGKDGKIPEYKFLQTVDVVKILSAIYLVFKAAGEVKEGKNTLHISKLRFYALDIFNIQEVKFEEFIQLMKDENLLETGMDADNLPKVLIIPSVELLKNILTFFSGQRTTADEKKLIISNKCERLLKRIYDQLIEKKAQGERVVADLSVVLDDFKMRNIPISIEDLDDALKAGLVEEVVVRENNKLTTEVHFTRLKTLFPFIQLNNALTRFNEGKQKKY